MARDYSTYTPLQLEKASLATLKSPGYRRFIHDAAIVSGIRLLLERHRRQPDWPYVDTKFNPNSGRDLGEASYRVVFAWFLGRGSEALQGHLARLGQFEDLSAAERREAEEVFAQIVVNMTDAIIKVADRNHGRCPFRVNRDLLAIDEHGKRIEADGRISSAGDRLLRQGADRGGHGGLRPPGDGHAHADGGEHPPEPLRGGPVRGAAEGHRPGPTDADAGGGFAAASPERGRAVAGDDPAGGGGVSGQRVRAALRPSDDRVFGVRRCRNG